MKRPGFGRILIAMLAIATAAQADWTAYNDCVHGNFAPNVTIYSGYMGDGGGFEVPSGPLQDFSTGGYRPVTATLAAANVSGSGGRSEGMVRRPCPSGSGRRRSMARVP